MVGWSTGTRMVAVDVAIAHRGPRDVADGDDTRIVARLLRTDFDHAARRAHLFAGFAMFAKKVVLTKRIQWFEGSNGSPSFNHCWMIWDRQHRGPPTLAYASHDYSRMSALARIADSLGPTAPPAVCRA